MVSVRIVKTQAAPVGVCFVLPDVTVHHRLGETVEEWYSRVAVATSRDNSILLLCGTREKKNQ